MEIFLLADDPQKLTAPITSGDPFPGSIWIKLTPTVVPASTGSFTLPVAVETLA
ncbi:hypothetical protein [Geotalea toluenoxydans]|uniref:hypothetical protein n=1 Tax=Geotalea toluenoxydans TaxID=421624 RepID=UPI001FB29209|nr:hypothetical protein [Geotalea toluenoxydans]